MTFPTRDCLSHGSVRLTYAALQREVNQLVTALRPWAGMRVGVYLRDSPQLVAALIALDQLGVEAHLIGGDTSVPQAEVLLDRCALEICLADDDRAGKRFNDLEGVAQSIRVAVPNRSARPPAQTGRVVLFTSGTSGEAKGALHTWESLAAGIRRETRHAGARWLLTYGLTRFAGLQVFLQAFLSGGCLAIPPSQDVADILTALRSEGIDHVSGTPTFWRKLLTGASTEQLRARSLKQITLGGEIVTQAILNALRAAFPEAQLTHIYASTEMGVCFSVKDGREGFPAAFLQPGVCPVQLKVQDGELWIRSLRAMQQYLGQRPLGDEWFATGDLVEQRGDRIYFLGRKSEIINVGGSKVYPEEVEEQIRQVPGVADVRVYGVKSSFVGQLVRADVVADAVAVPSELRARILARCSETLPSYKQPKLLEFVPELPETVSGKLARQEEGD